MARVLTGIAVNRYFLNSPRVTVEWVDGEEHGRAEFVDDDARAIVDADSGAIDHAEMLARLAALEALAKDPGSVTRRMTEASDAAAAVRDANAARDLATQQAEAQALEFANARAATEGMMSALNSATAAKAAAVADLTAMHAERATAAAELEDARAAKASILSELTNQRNAVLANLEDARATKAAKLAELDSASTELASALAEADALLAAKRAELARVDAELAAKAQG